MFYGNLFPLLWPSDVENIQKYIYRERFVSKTMCYIYNV